MVTPMVAGETLDGSGDHPVWLGLVQGGGEGKKSKHLKGQLGPRVGDVTFFNHGGQLGPCVGDVTFFNHGGQLGTCVGDVTFFNQWRSVGTLRW